MVSEIKDSKYYAIILDCTPDVSHQEQMSVVVHTLSLGKTSEIKEQFLGFLVALESTGQGLSELILQRLEELNIPFEDCRGQSYDNAANMKGANKGVQARLIKKKIHKVQKLYVPCGAHTLNLVISDAAKVSVDATCFFGNMEKIYNLFSGSPQRWVREALLEVRERTTDFIVKVETHSLAEGIGSFRFQIYCVVWYDILSQINTTGKLLQSANMQIDVAVSLIEKNKQNLISYRAAGFKDAQVSAKDMCEQMNTEAVLKQKRLRTTTS